MLPHCTTSMSIWRTRNFTRLPMRSAQVAIVGHLVKQLISSRIKEMFSYHKWRHGRARDIDRWANGRCAGSASGVEGADMTLSRRQFLHLAAGGAAVPVLSRNGRAQAYPARPVRLIVGATAGSSPDILARLI